jgi:hypothetical protein
MEKQIVFGVGIDYEGIFKVFANREDAEAYLANPNNYADYIEEMEVC